MKIIIITGDQPEHHFVANKIADAYPVQAILVCDPPPRRSWQTILRKSPLMLLDKAARALFLRAIGDAKTRTASLIEVLGESAITFAHPHLVERVGKPNGQTLAQRVAALAPDVLAIYGTGIIPDNVLKSASTIALNMHTGLSPFYRGVACAAWPILDKRPEMVGATVHRCTANVDGGLIYFRQAAALQNDDNLHMVFARAVATGAKGYLEVIDRAQRGALKGELQDLSIGREYRGTMLGFRSEVKTRRALRQLQRQQHLGTAR